MSPPEQEPVPPPGIRVSGGAGGIDARFDDLERLGRLYDATRHDLVAMAWDDKGQAADADLLASAVLSPASFAEAEQAVLAATLGPRGLAARAAALEVDALGLGACVELYRAADAARGASLEGLHYALGFVVGVQLPGVLVGGAAGYAALRLTGTDDEVVGWVEDHPRVLETAVGAGGGLLDGMQVGPVTSPVVAALGLRGFHPGTGAAAADLGALLFGDHRGELDPAHPPDEFDHPAPAGIRDLLDALDVTAAADRPDGVFSVQRLDHAGGTAYVVQLPGTDDFLADDVVRNTGSNLALVAREPTAYAEAVGQAMVAAGVDPSSPVMLVGHSQGGMQAAALAADPGFGYRVTHVVTAGSPVATAGVPDDVTVLSLENTGDVVPLLDGEPNPALAHHVTVQSDVHTGHLGAAPGQNHAGSTYAAIAAAVDASDDPSVRQVLQGMRETGFLSSGGTTSRTWSFRAVPGEELRPAGIAALRERLE